MVMDVLHSVLVFPGSVVVSEWWCVSGRPLAWVLMSFGTDTSSRAMLMLNISHERGDGCGVDEIEICLTRLLSVLPSMSAVGVLGGSQEAGRAGVHRDR